MDEREPPIMDELWVTLEGLETYNISNYGRIVNDRTGKEVKNWIDAEGHLRARIYRRGKRYSIYVHLLVARTFFLRYRSGVGVGFINGRKADCSVANLTLITPGPEA